MSIGLFNVFFSPRIHLHNQQVTWMELEGLEWFLNYRDQEILFDNIGFGPGRFANAILGLKTPPKNIGWAISFPEHFGYNNYTVYGELYTEDRYFLFNQAGKIYYPNVHPNYPELWKYTSNDFNRLNSDPSVDRIYSNGEFEVNYIIAEKKSIT